MRLKTGDAGEERVCEDFDVGAHAREKHGEHDAIQDAEGMVRDGDERTFSGNAVEVRRQNVEIDLHLREQTFEAEAPWGGVDAAIEIAGLLQGNKFSGELRKPGEKRSGGEYTCVVVCRKWKFMHDRLLQFCFSTL